MTSLAEHSAWNGTLGDLMGVLSRARAQVRSRSRTPRYFEHADRFASAFLGETIGVPLDSLTAPATDLPVVLDDCYEALLASNETEGHARDITARWAGLLELGAACAELPRALAALERETCSLQDAASGLISATTVLGHAVLTASIGADVADTWLGCWRSAVTQHNQQQQSHLQRCVLLKSSVRKGTRSAGSLSVDDVSLMPLSRGFGDGAREYVGLYADTAAGAMALVGGIPFGEALPGEVRAGFLQFLANSPGFLRHMNEIFRFAQDVRFDPSEPLSCGIFALAAERQCSLVEIDVTELDPEALSRRMAAEWRPFLEEKRAEMKGAHRRWSAELAHRRGTGGDPLSLVIERSLAITCRIGEALTEGPHKG